MGIIKILYERKVYMKNMKYLYYFTATAMIIGLINVFLNGNFALEGGALLKNNWGLMILIDLFAGLIIFYSWVAFREKNVFKIIIMLPFTLFFGFLTASIYILYNLNKSKGDLTQFFLGDRRDQVLEYVKTKGS